MKVYLAGPMTGIPQCNFPAFDAAAEALRQAGHDVVSPAELDSEAARETAFRNATGAAAMHFDEHGETWGDLLARDIKLIADTGIEAIFVLPGWERSRGARLETFVGSRMQGLPVYEFETSNEVPLSTLAIAWVHGSTLEDITTTQRQEAA